MPPKIWPGITELAQKFQGILLDAYGVFWGGNKIGPIPGAKEAMKTLVEAGKIVGVLSNSTQLAEHEIHKLHAHGICLHTHFHFLLTSGEIARSVFLAKDLPFETPQNKFWLLGTPHHHFSSHEPIFLHSSYKETKDIKQADFIYVATPHIGGEDQIDIGVFNQSVKDCLSYGLPMICPNPDRFAHEGNPPKAVIRQGSIASLYEKQGGQVFYIGKPTLRAYVAAMKEFSFHGRHQKEEILMVGDTPETDIQGAKLFGMPSALVTQTGMMADRISKAGLDSALSLLPPSCVPDFFIERLLNDIPSASKLS